MSQENPSDGVPPESAPASPQSPKSPIWIKLDSGGSDGERLLTPPSPPRQQGKKWWGSLGVVGILIAKFAGKLPLIWSLLKLAGPFAKTGLSMVLSIGVYSLQFGWRFALGFVLLIFIHELGHVAMARWNGIRVSAPLFIPFLGAQILLRQQLPDAWVESKIGVGGPIAGSLGALACHGIYLVSGEPLFAALAHVAYWLNFFNLIPIVPLDGGRVMAAISPWAWIPGYLLMAVWFGIEVDGAVNHGRPLGTGSFILLLVLVTSLPRVLRLFRRHTTETERYYMVPANRRWTMAFVYFGLVISLWIGMKSLEVTGDNL